MTTIVYTEEVMSSNSPNSGPKNAQKLTVKIMEDRKSGGFSGTPVHQRGGSPKPQKSTRFSVRGTRKLQGHHYPTGYSQNVFTITAYLPHDGGRRLKLQCVAGMTVQEVIESEIPDIARTGYQVYQFPSRALLNPEKDASILQDQEISIEPMKPSTPELVEDERLALVKELLRTEDGYLENLKNIFDIYMEPLRKWGMPQPDLNILFRSLSRLCDLLMNFFSELELAVKYWNTSKTLIGGLFKQYPSFWDMYEEYSQSYTQACRLLKEKKMLDESFQRFLDMKRGAAMHTLESLMLLPVQRIYDYHRLLVQLYSITVKGHPDYHDLRYTVACVSTMVQARERQLNQYQNETKLDQVQLRFPNDTLYLSEALDYMESFPKKMSKNMSSPSVSRAHGGHTKKHSTPVLDLTDSGLGESGRQSMRLYIQEGPVKIIQGLQTHDRFLFLFGDLLLIAKPTGRQRSQHRTYKLKERLRLSEMWVTDCVDEVMETTLPPKTAFVVGWPITNCVASFATPGEKSLWHNLLTKNIAAQRQLVHPDSVSIRIVNLTKSSNNLPIWMQVHASEHARDVLSRALDLFAIAVSESNCQMWVKYSRDEAAYPLIGHECPFAIQIHHNRLHVDFNNGTNSVGDNRPTQLQFVIKRKSAVPGDSQSTSQQTPRTKKPFKRTKLMAWYRVARGRKGREGGRQKYRIFGVPLNTIMINGQLPEVLQEILIRLYTDGPTTMGIFRQSANHRKVKETKESINNREQVDLSELSIHVIGALLKEILRNVPGGVLMSSRYTEFVATNDIKDVPTRVIHIQKVLSKLPEENQVFLCYLMPLLHCIARNEEINGMNSINLAICCAPSVLWPDSGLDVIKNEVPPLVQFMVEHCPQIFGSELPELFKQLPVGPGVVRYVPTKVDDGETMTFRHGRSDSLDTSTSEESAGEEEPVSTLLRARRSGLTVSDSQLSVLSHQLDEIEKAKSGRRVVGSREMELDGKHIAEQMELEAGPPSPTRRAPSPKRHKRSLRPERSNSYRSPGEKASNLRVRYHGNSDQVSRRKSIATQTTLERPKRRGEFFPQDFHVIPPSPNSSMSSSSQIMGFSPYLKPHLMESIDDEPEGSPYEYQSDELPHKRKSSQKKRRIPQYSHSFSKESENKPEKPIPTSHSYYDKLLPLDPEARTRSRSLANPNVITLKAMTGSHHGSLDESELGGNITWPTDKIANGELHEVMGVMTPLRTPLPTVELGKPAHPHTSNQSVASSRSGSSSGSQTVILRTSAHPSSLPSRNSNLSLTSSHSGGSGGSMNRASPDPLSILEQTPLHKIDREFVKAAISRRFGISTPTTASPQDIHAPYARSSSFSSSATYHEVERARMRAAKAEPSYSKDGRLVEDKYQEVKLEERRRANSDVSYTKGFGSSVEKKEGLLGVVMENPSFDDRPESEQHLNSLPRDRPLLGELIRPPHMHKMHPFVSGPPEIVQVAAMGEHEHEHDVNRLYPGYSSDTESSPSRTLNRPEKLQEVASPPGKIMPQRYKTQLMYPGGAADRARRYQPHYESPYRHLPPSSSVYPRTLRQYPSPASEAARLPTATLEAQHVSPQLKEVSQASQEEKVITTTRQHSFHKVIDVSKNRSHRDEKEREPVVTKATTAQSKVGVTMVKVRSSESPKAERTFYLRDRSVTSALGESRVEVGMSLPPPRQRSKSTSEDEAMRIIHKVTEEPEEVGEGRSERQETDRTKKYEGWLSCAPTSTERRLAWEQRSKNASRSSEVRDIRSRSLKQDTGGSPALPPKVVPQPSPSQTRKSATMPELFARQGRPGSRRIGMVRTVKITSYHISEPQRIRRINLRTYYN